MNITLIARLAANMMSSIAHDYLWLLATFIRVGMFRRCDVLTEAGNDLGQYLEGVIKYYYIGTANKNC